MASFPAQRNSHSGQAARRLGLWFGLIAVAGLICSQAVATPSTGTVLSNQATASYLDTHGAVQTAASNTVQATISQVASFTLVASSSRFAAPGSTVYFPHTVTNTGNGMDSFRISATVQAGAYLLANVAVYADANGDGVPDTPTPITGTPSLIPGGAYHFVVGGTVPPGAVVGATDAVRVDAASISDPSQSTTGGSPAVTPNTDSVTTTNGAVVTVTKDFSGTSGPSPSGPFTVTLRYNNSSTIAATAVTLADHLPAGLVYVPASGRWNGTGSLPLSDGINVPDDQGAAPNIIDYDFGVTAANTVTATISQVPAGFAGTVSFQVSIAAGLAATRIDNTASFRYNDGTSLVGPTPTNSASLSVGSAASVSLLGAAVPSAVAGSSVLFVNQLINTGNAPDSFDITLGANNFPAGTSFVLLQSNGINTLNDTNGNGVADTGILAPGASYSVVVKATLPAGLSGGPFNIQKSARSKNDPTKSVTVSDALNAVTLTNGSAAVLKLTKSVSAAIAQPGTVLNYTLSVTNTGGSTANGPNTISIDGANSTVVLLRDAIPANTTVSTAMVVPAGATALYHVVTASAGSYTTGRPTDLTAIDAVAFAWGSIAAGYSGTASFSVTVNSNAASAGSGQIQNVANIGYLDGVNAGAQNSSSNGVSTSLPASAGTIRNYSNPTYAQAADFVPVGTTLYLRANAASCNQNASAIETHLAIITGPNGERETYTATETGPNTGVFSITAVPTRAPPVVVADGVIEANNGDTLSVALQGCATPVVNTLQLIDPTGVAFDSRSNAPISGASVALVVSVGGVCTAVPAMVATRVGDTLQTSPATVLTGSDGRFMYPLVAPGSYCLVVTPPAGYGAPSTVPVNALPSGRRIVASGATAGASYGGSFSVGPTTGPITVDIPLDSHPITGLMLEKKASRTTAEIADFIDYQLQFKNGSTAILTGTVMITDQLPAGFSYQPGTAMINGKTASDPLGGHGPRLQFAIGPAAVNAVVTLSYRVRVGPSALQGDGINRAQASYGGSQSNMATASVNLQGGVFSDQGFILGKIFLDCNRNRVQDEGELGIPGIRLYLEDGTNVTTDAEGKYSLYGINPRTHVLKLDATTLPAGAELISLANRNAGDAGSLFVDMKAGELHRADFAEGSCNTEVMIDVTARRAKSSVQLSEAGRVLNGRMDADSATHPIGDVKALPASGAAGVVASPERFDPLSVHAEATALSVSGQAVHATSRSPTTPLETLLPTLDNQLAFIGLADQDTLPIAQMNVRVKGALGATFELSVNQQIISNKHVGKKSSLASKGLLAWEYIGVDLKPGINHLAVRELDAGGNERRHQTLSVIAPDQLGQLTVNIVHAVPADGRSAARVEVRLTDAHGVPVTARTPLTLEATLGRWDTRDLDPKEPGVQVFIEGGRAEFRLIAPQDPGSSRIRVSSGTIQGEVMLDFLPHLRPMIAAGLIEGVLNLRKLDSRALVPANSQDAFESELRSWSHGLGSQGADSIAARTALFLKGKVKGDYLLTAGFDSDKDSRQRLFRDIQPDAFYPVYGDSSVRGFDAQSSGRLYVRIDKNKSYLLYGDFQTQSATEARKLGNYSRSLNGLRNHYESNRVSVNSFASQDSTRQTIDEIAADGTSGPFALSAVNFVENSEKVEVLTRDRNQPAIILSAVGLTRFSDYEIEPLTGRLLLRTPMASRDANLNPISLRVTYEVDQTGPKFWVAGVDAQVRVTKALELGGAYVEDRNPADPSKLKDFNATVRLGPKTFLIGELAETDQLVAGKGTAKRVELKHDSGALQADIYDGKADVSFNNPGSSLTRGRAEAGARLKYQFDERTVIRSEALRTEDTTSLGTRQALFVSVDRRLAHKLHIEIGMRHVNETVAAAQPTSVGATPLDFTSTRVKASGPVPGLAKANMYAEYEQALNDATKKIGAIGGDYQFADRGRLYLRHEFLSSLSGPNALNSSQKQNATVIGLDTDYLKDAHLFSEYRVRDAYSGGDAEAAIGLRNQWIVAQGTRLQTSFERVHTLSGSGREEATAGTIGLEYTANPLWKGTGRVELRNATTSNSLLSTIGFAAKINRDWTFLGRGALGITRNHGTVMGKRVQDRAQAGIAYRDTDTDIWNALARLEHTDLRDTSNLLLPINRHADVASLSANVQPTKPLVMTGRIASKWSLDESNGIRSRAAAQLASIRATYEWTSRWDVGVQTSALASNGFRSRQIGVGAEVGHLVTGNLWVSAGYNLFGFKDADLTSSDYTSRGIFIRLRFKFDEDLFASSDRSAPAAANAAAVDLP